MGILREDQHAFYDHISLYSSQNEKRFKQNCREEVKTHILWSMTGFFFFENRAVYEIM